MPESNARQIMRSKTCLFCALGFGLLSAYTSVISVTSVQIATDVSIDGLVFAMRVLQIVVFLTVALLSTRCKDLAAHRALMAVCAATCALVAVSQLIAVSGLEALASGGTQLFFQAVSWKSSAGAHYFACIARGVAPSLLWLAWIELYARMDMRHVLVYYLLASIISAVLTLIVGALPAGATTLIAACLPLASALLLAKSVPLVRNEPFAQGEPVSEAWSFPVVPVVLMGIFTVANVFARNILPAADRLWPTFGAVVVCLVGLAVALVSKRGHVHIWHLYEWAYPLTLAGLFGLLLTASSWGMVSTVCTHAGEALFSVFIGVVLCNISYRYGVSSLLLFGFSQAAGSLGGAVGGQLAKDLPASGDAFTLAVACLALALSICYVVLTHHAEGEATWGVSREATVTLQPPAAVLAASDELQLRCSRVAYSVGLTRREEQVLSLLAQDRTAAEIEKALCVSNSTVKTHTHAVYQKLGVHSRAELIEYMEKEA